MAEQISSVTAGTMMYNGISSSNAVNNEKKAFSYAKEEDNDALGKDTFLQLMITKLSNQDPLSPTDDTEFLTQLAQYTSLEQMINMSSAIEMQQGFDMVGKYVIIEYKDSYYSGKVDSVIHDSGEIKLDVGGMIVGMDAVKEVMASEYVPEQTPSEGEGDAAAGKDDTSVDTDGGKKE